MTFEELCDLRRKVDRVVSIRDGKELGRGIFYGCNEFMTQIKIDGKEKLASYSFMNFTIRREEPMDQQPKTKVLGKSKKTKKGKPHGKK